MKIDLTWSEFEDTRRALFLLLSNTREQIDRTRIIALLDRLNAKAR